MTERKPVATLWAAPTPNGRWFGFFSSVTSIWCSDKSRARLIDLYEDPEGDYYGWYAINDPYVPPGVVCMVQPSKLQWEMQSPDFFRNAIATGEGRMIRMVAVPRDTTEVLT